MEGSIRLVGGFAANEGRVEVYHNGVWGTVCDDFWDVTNANVVCRQLNYSGATAARSLAYFGHGSGPIHYDNVRCTGNETRLADCSHRGIGVHDCGHREDAGVVCRNTTQGELILYFSPFVHYIITELPTLGTYSYINKVRMSFIVKDNSFVENELAIYFIIKSITQCIHLQAC